MRRNMQRWSQTCSSNLLNPNRPKFLRQVFHGDCLGRHPAAIGLAAEKLWGQLWKARLVLRAPVTASACPGPPWALEAVVFLLLLNIAVHPWGSYRHHPYLGVGTEQKSWAWLRAAASCSWPITATVCPFSPNGSVVLTRQLSVISSEGGECPNKMSTKRRVAEKKPAEPPLPRRNPNEKLIQAETTEVGTVSCGSPLPFSSFFFFLEKKSLFFFHLLCFC